MLEVYFVEYFVEYFTEKKLLFTKKRVLFWKKNDIERASKINNSLNLLAFWGKQTTGIEPASSAWEADILPMNYVRIST